jgi:hypothetical protein
MCQDPLRRRECELPAAGLLHNAPGDTNTWVSISNWPQCPLNANPSARRKALQALVGWENPPGAVDTQE